LVEYLLEVRPVALMAFAALFGACPSLADCAIRYLAVTANNNQRNCGYSKDLAPPGQAGQA
jgi:hypothetical protein